MKYLKKFENDKDNDIRFLILAIDTDANYNKGSYFEAKDVLEKITNVNIEIDGKTPTDHLVDRIASGNSGKYVNWENNDLVKIAKLLVENGAKFRDSDILKILNKQAHDTDEIKKSNELIKLILKTNININYFDKHGSNALMYAIVGDLEHESSRFYNLNVIKKIIESGIDLTHEDEFGQNFINYIEQYSKRQEKKLLSKVNIILFDNKDKENVKDWFLHQDTKKYNL